jgi:mRNA interferase MazF
MGVFAAGQVALLPAGASREDWIVCQVTSNPFGDPRSLPLTASDFSIGALRHTSYVRPGKVFTAHDSLIAAVVGTLKPEMLTAIRNAVIAIIQQD